jgi:hypothetical protein
VETLNWSVVIPVVIISLIVYFIPTFAGFRKKHGTGILILNIFLGWTLLGWIIALVWAASSPVKEEEWINTCDKCGFQKTFSQNLKLFKCPQCGFENLN